MNIIQNHMSQKLSNNFKIDIKNYLKEKIIYESNYSIVYLAREKKTKKIFVAKVIRCSNKEEIQKSIDREIGIMMTARHRAIIRLIGYSLKDFFSEDHPTVIMQYVTNGSLLDVLNLIRKNIFPKNYTNSSRQIILLGIASGMKYLHSNNIIHRDIKPGNILLDENYHPLISDFGLSKKFEDGHSYIQSINCGTLPYMAPEIIRGDDYNRKADVYSFGVLMYEIISNQAPYPELLSNRLKDFVFMRKVTDDFYRPQITFSIKPSLENLMVKCWSDKPSDRPTFTEIYSKLKNEFIYDDVSEKEVSIYVNEIENGGFKLLSDIDEAEVSLKVIFLGSHSVGKTSILYKYFESSIIKKSTVGPSVYVKRIQTGNQTVTISFWDTAGQEQYRSLLPSYFRDTSVVFLVYDVTVEQSFIDLDNYCQMIKDLADMEYIKIFLLCNKIDLVSSYGFSDEVEEFKEKYQIEHSFLTSAKTGEGIESAFKELDDLIENGNVFLKNDKTLLIQNEDEDSCC